MSNDISFPVNQRIVELDIQGMTCASCVGRVERKLGKIEGVEALVNLPLESARITVPENVSDEQLIATVQSAGYQASLKVDQYASAPAAPASHAHAAAEPTSGSPAANEAHTMPGMNHAADPSRSDLKKRLVVGAIFTVPLFIISMVPAAQFPHWGWVALALATPVVFWSAWPFHRAAAINARHFASTMDTLVSIGVLAAYLFSLWQLVADPNITAHTGMSMSEHALYFETAGVVATFLLLGRYLEARAKARAGDALKTLLDLGAKEATVLRDGVETKIAASELVPGDEFVVRPGEKIATDGFVVSGHSAIDTALVTGESVPVEVGPDDTVTGATINTSGRLVVRATRVGRDTTLAQMGRLVSEAQTGKAPIARLADRISAVFVPIVLAIAVLTFVLWLAVHRRPGLGIRRGRRGAGHRLPVRPGPRDAHRPAGRHGPRRPAGHPDPRTAGPRGHPQDRHRAAGQDRHHHRGQSRRRLGHPGRRIRRGRAAGPGRRGRVRLRAPDRPRHRRGRKVRRPAGRGHGLHLRPGRRRPRRRRHPHCRRGTGKLAQGERDRADRRTPRKPGRGTADRRHLHHGRRRRILCRPGQPDRHRQGHPLPRRSPG